MRRLEGSDPVRYRNAGVHLFKYPCGPEGVPPFEILLQPIGIENAPSVFPKGPCRRRIEKAVYLFKQFFHGETLT